MINETEEMNTFPPNKVGDVAERLENLTNVCGCQHSLKMLANRMASMHRTLAQSFTSGFVIPFVREMARRFRRGDFDARNRASTEACDDMAKALEARYDIGEMDELSFPCI